MKNHRWESFVPVFVMIFSAQASIQSSWCQPSCKNSNTDLSLVGFLLIMKSLLSIKSNVNQEDLISFNNNVSQEFARTTITDVAIGRELENATEILAI